MHYRISFLIVFVSVLFPAVAFPWGSLYPGETHQYILDTAYTRLSADPAYASNLFPTLSLIKAHEGVQWTAGSAVRGGSDYSPVGLFGIGPDGAGMSTYSEHYYNPKTGEGNGPTSSARHFSSLIKSNLSGKPNSEAGAKSAAYSAHFLADMFVPYHVVGTSRKNAQKIWDEQNKAHPGVINLGTSITGSPKLSFLTPFKGGNNNFYTELSRVIRHTDPNETDWFDPWYFNGNTDIMMINTSSHVAWEATPPGVGLMGTMSIIHQQAGQGVPGYDPQWKNAAVPRFDQDVWDGQSQQVSKLAVYSATETRSRLEAYFEDPTPAVMNAIQSVFSIWRASFSGMRPTIAYQPDGKNSYKITGNIGNSAGAQVNSVQARLTAKDCTVTGSPEQTLNMIGAGSSKATVPWNVTTTDKLCNLKLEAVGSYPIPDLQYAFVETSFFPQQKQEPVKPVSKPETPRTQPVVDKDAKGAWVLVDVSKTDLRLRSEKDIMLKRVPGCKPRDAVSSDNTYAASSTDNSFSYNAAIFGTGKTKSYRYTWDVQGSWDKPPASLLPGEIFNFGCTARQVLSGDHPNPLGAAISLTNGSQDDSRTYALCSSNLKFSSNTAFPASNTATWKMKAPIPDSDWDCRNYGRRCTEEPIFKLGVEADGRGPGLECYSNEFSAIWFHAMRTYTYKWKPGAAGSR